MLNLTPTYEVNIGLEPLHPDPTVASRFIEVAMGKCKYGCKIYADPMSRVNVLAHYRVYGCNKTQEIIASEQIDVELVRDCESVEL